MAKNMIRVTQNDQRAKAHHLKVVGLCDFKASSPFMAK